MPAGTAAIAGAVLGLICALIAWLVYAAVGYGGVNKDNLFEVRLYWRETLCVHIHACKAATRARLSLMVVIKP